MKKVFLIAPLAFCAFSLLAQQTAPVKVVVQGEDSIPACKKEVLRLCKDAEGDHSAMAQCLDVNMGNLSAVCRGLLAQGVNLIDTSNSSSTPSFWTIKRVCDKEIQKICSRVKGNSRILHCLRQHESALSNQCRAVVAP